MSYGLYASAPEFLRCRAASRLLTFQRVEQLVFCREASGLILRWQRDWVSIDLVVGVVGDLDAQRHRVTNLDGPRVAVLVAVRVFESAVARVDVRRAACGVTKGGRGSGRRRM